MSVSNSVKLALNAAVFEVSVSHPEAGKFVSWIMKNGGTAYFNIKRDERITALGVSDSSETENLVWEAFCNA